MKTIKDKIKQIITNPYIGLALLIKDVFEIINGVLVYNLKISEIMDYSTIVSIVINLFIAIVIYNLLTQYKNKVDKEQFKEQSESFKRQLKEQNEFNKELSRFNEMIVKHTNLDNSPFAEDKDYFKEKGVISKDVS